MSESRSARRVPAVHATKPIAPDPDFELGLAAHLKATHSAEALLELLSRYANGRGDLDCRLRRCLWRALTRHMGHGVRIGVGVACTHAETFEIGAAVFIGDQACLQGRIDGTCRLGDHVWIGPQAYLDARDLIVGEYVGLGPGVRILGSVHTGLPRGTPIIATDLDIGPVRIERGADVGTGAIILPGVTLGEGCQIGAGAVVTHDVPAYAVAAGVPARVVRERKRSD